MSVQRSRGRNVPPEVYREYVAARRRLIIPLAGLVSGAYLLLVGLASFTSVLDGALIGSFTWAYAVAFVQFLIAVIVVFVYRRRMEVLDTMLHGGDDRPDTVVTKGAAA